MKTVPSLPPSNWQVEVGIHVERAGQAILGKGCRELLESVERCQSISAAARDRGISYRHAWLMIQGMNDGAGEPLIVAATGGRHGGGARLTTLGQWTLRVFRAMEEQLQHSATAFLQRATAPLASDCVHVSAAVCLEEVLGQLLTDFNLDHPEVRVRAVFGASDELADHVLAGAPVDLFVSAGPDPLRRLEDAGIAEAATRTVLAENTLAAIGAANRRLPIRSSDDLLRAGVTRIALAEPGTPLGRYTLDYLDRLGLRGSVLERAVYVDNSRAVGAAVRGGSADVGLVYGSDAVQAAGCRLLFKAQRGPSPIQLCGALVRRGCQVDRAGSLLSFLASTGAAGRFRQCGFLPSPTAARGG